jgi:hypothetical protein
VVMLVLLCGQRRGSRRDDHRKDQMSHKTSLYIEPASKWADSSGVGKSLILPDS